ncbi:hypothetical protein QAD02_023805, partial [Eretmocerus hayati]
MAKMRTPKKFNESKFVTAAAPVMSANKERWSSLGSSNPSSCSSSPENSDSGVYCTTLDDVINSIRNIKLLQGARIIDHQPENLSCSSSSSGSGSSDEDDDDGKLIERGPLRPHMHPSGRPRPYLDSTLGQTWAGSGLPIVPGDTQQHQHGSEASADYETSAKAILTDQELREKIDSCLDKLSDLNHPRQIRPESGTAMATVAMGASSYSHLPDQKQNIYQPARSPNAFVPSITVCDSESSLLEILTKGGFQPAQQQINSVGEQYRPAASNTSSLGCPDSPASCCAPSSASTTSCSSRPNSRASSRAQSPGPQSHQGQNQLQLNPLSSPTGSPQTYQPQNVSINSSMHSDNLQFPTAADNLVRRTSWQDFQEHSSGVSDAASFSHVKDFQLPNTVVTYDSQRLRSRSSDCTLRGVRGNRQRSIAPWPSLNLPPTRACEHLKEITDPHEVEKAMKSLLKKPIEQLAERDADGDTMLMCLTGNPVELSKKLAYLVPLVERMGSLDGALSILNRHGEDALYLASINCPRMAFVAGYLGAALLQRDVDIGQRLYGTRGDTLIHVLAAKGDAYVDIMAELLSLRTSQGGLAFDLTKRNCEGKTSLHVAAEAHDSTGPNSRTISLATARLLLERGADPTTREIRCGDTALHLAVSLSCDPELVK